MEKISAHRILAELKILPERIQAATNHEFVGFYVGEEGVPNGYKTVEEFVNRAKAKYQSLHDLIKRRNVLKAALVASNAVTIVNIAGKEMTVAEAIDRKDSIQLEKNVLNNLRGQYGNVVNRVEGQRRVLDMQVNKRIEDAAGKDRKVSKEEEESLIEMTKKRFEPHFVDPIGITEEIDRLLEEIQKFELEVDTALSESNARTEIEIPE